MRKPKMTRRRAWELSLLVWSYLAEFPEIRTKAQLPKAIYDRIRDLYFRCPLCEAYCLEKRSGVTCAGCPIERRCIHGPRLYARWEDAETVEDRRIAALRMLREIAKNEKGVNRE